MVHYPSHTAIGGRLPVLSEHFLNHYKLTNALFESKQEEEWSQDQMITIEHLTDKHYENMPMQYTEIFQVVKMIIFSRKIF